MQSISEHYVILLTICVICYAVFALFAKKMLLFCHLENELTRINNYKQNILMMNIY